ncbi:helix-turn-helix transcriptional regulator [Streptomyces griseus]|uniref:helix-turn-helix transcriptional regulator n=1 Tax=Streptomyces griseus TaxID=1911 RepID=UPI00130232B8|nr:helix-turn-helix transcriptional regulator [Streptomyces fimicarius]
MTRDWARLGEALKSARVARGIEQQEVAQTIGVKRGALNNIEHGRIARVTTTVLAYARLVGWTGKSIDLVLGGGDPVLADDPTPAPVASAETFTRESAVDPVASDLSLLVQQALREGPLLDSRVTELTTPAGRVRATIVIRGEEGLPEEELLAALRSLKIDVTSDGE